MTTSLRPDGPPAEIAVPESGNAATPVEGRRGGDGLGQRGLGAARRSAAAGLPALGFAAALVLLWQWYASRPEVDAQLLPTPLAVWTALVSQRDILWHHTLVTLGETVVGFAVALAAGMALGTAISFTSWLRRPLYPLLVASQTIPIITLAPLLVLWFGFGLAPKAIVVLLVCFFPVTVALADGLRAADPELIKLYRSFGAGALRIFWSVRLPGALPSLFSGIRIAITYSVIGAIFSEYVAATEGLGYYMELKQHVFATAAVIAAIVVTAALSIALFALTTAVERLALPWYYSQGRGE